MVIAVNNIESLNWSPKLGEFGQIVENIADIEQCIKIILTTPRGSDPHRPTFASGIFNYIDYPQTTIKQLLIRETYESILIWEPRINIENVSILFNQQELGSIDIKIKWTVKNSTLQTITIVNIQ